jgi:hypothetical protein
MQHAIQSCWRCQTAATQQCMSVVFCLLALLLLASRRTLKLRVRLLRIVHTNCKYFSVHKSVWAFPRFIHQPFFVPSNKVFQQLS